MKKVLNPKYGGSNFHGMRWAYYKGVFVEDFERKIKLTKKRLVNKVVLDVGCNDGKNVFRFSSIVKEIYGIEVMEECVNLAIKNNDKNNVFFKKGDAEKIPFSDNKFDVVYSLWVLEHLRNPAKFFEEVFRVLKPGGILILWAPSVLNPTGFLIKLVSNNYKTKFLSILSKKPVEEVSDMECFYRANYVRAIDKLTNENLVRIFLERYDNPAYFSKSRFLTYLWYLRYRLTNNRFLDFIKPSFYVEYKKLK